jgi:hypothetical protein
LREETDKLRDGLQGNIVEMSLFWGTKEDQFVSRDEITALIVKEIYLIAFPELVFDAIISRLLAKGTLEKNENGLYALRDSRRVEIEKHTEQNQRRIDIINTTFIQRLEHYHGVGLLQTQKDESLARFYSFLASIIMERSELVARIIAGKTVEVLPTDLPIQTLGEILARIGDKKLRDSTKDAIESLFKEGSEDFSSFLFSLAQNLTCINILNLDPECQALEREAFANKVLFLDTNVLIALLCPTHFMHKVVEQLIMLSQSLGAKCVVTTKTYEEYLVQLEEANYTYAKWTAPYRYFETVDDDFLSSFWIEKKSNASQNWKGYYYRMKQIKSVLKKLNIEYSTESFENVRKDPNFDIVKEAVRECYRSMKGRNKSAKVCEHDALHMLLMRTMRKRDESAFLGPNQWFITSDESLLCVDNRINMLANSDKIPSSMLSDLWLEMITPFLPTVRREKEAYEAFSILVKRQFATIPFALEADTFLEIQGSWMKYDWLETKDIVRIQNEEWVKRYIKRVRDAKRDGARTSKVEELATVFATKMETELKRARALRKTLENKHFKVIEVYPGGAQDVLGIPRKQQGLERLRTGLEKAGVRGLNNRMSDHELDAVTCALVGKLFFEGKSVTYGTSEQAIVMPKGEKLRSRAPF